MAGRGGGTIVNISSWLARLGADAATAMKGTPAAAARRGPIAHAVVYVDGGCLNVAVFAGAG